MTVEAKNVSPVRSLLFAPANHARRAEKVFLCGADVAVLDLEDAVPHAEKAAARTMLRDALSGRGATRAYVRVNGVSTPWCHQDLLAAVAAGVHGVMLPKTESAEDARLVDWLLTQLEAEAGLTPGAIELIPLVESAKGVLKASDIAASTPRVRCLAFGGGDYTSDVGIEWTDAEDEFAYARAQLVHASVAAGIDAPIDTVVLQVRDVDRFSKSAERAKRMGFQGKLCIHPDQVPAANRVFSPSEAQIIEAQRMLTAFRAAEGGGSASIQVDGVFVDYAVVRRATRILAQAGRLGS
jgi:citrate lyase subunit beta / citryl-CoA lyase